MQNNLLPVKAQVQQDRQHISDKRAMGDKRLQVGKLFVKAPDYERLSLLILDYYVVADLARADKLGYFDRQNKAVPDSLRLPDYEHADLLVHQVVLCFFAGKLVLQPDWALSVLDYWQIGLWLDCSELGL